MKNVSLMKEKMCENNKTVTNSDIQTNLLKLQRKGKETR